MDVLETCGGYNRLNAMSSSLWRSSECCEYAEDRPSLFIVVLSRKDSQRKAMVLKLKLKGGLGDSQQGGARARVQREGLGG